jgi:hypothetical protein
MALILYYRLIVQSNISSETVEQSGWYIGTKANAKLQLLV